MARRTCVWWVLGAAIGIPAALVAAVFLSAVHELEDVLWHDLPRELGQTAPPWYLVIGLPVVGAALVVIARRLLPGDGGHRLSDGLAATPTPPSAAPGIALAALAPSPSEQCRGPRPRSRAGIGARLALAGRLDLGERENAVLSTAGSFSAISALFGGPLVAGLLLMEAGIGMGPALVPALLPGLVAAACGYVIFLGLGDWGGLGTPSLAVRHLPAYEGTSVEDLLVGLAVGVAAGALMVAVRLLAARVDRLRAGGLGMPALLLGGGLVVGLVAQSADALGADSQDVLFSGQASIPNLLAEGSLGVVAVLVAAKALGHAISLGAGFRGGPVFPAIFLGIGLATFAVELLDVSPTLAVAIGTAAGMAAATRLLLAPLLFAALLVGVSGLDAIPRPCSPAPRPGSCQPRSIAA
jgi:H+/Cl- antiporter ClcA